MTVAQNTVDLTTIAQVQGYLGSSIAANNDEIQILITAISSWAMKYCSRDFRLTAYVETRNGRGGQVMLTAQLPIISVTGLTVNGQTVPPAVGPPWNSGYRNDAQAIYLFSPWCFSRAFQNVVISYSAGWVTPGMFGLTPGAYPGGVTLPYDISQAVAEAVAERFKRRDSIGIISKTLAGEVITYSQADLPKSAAPVFDAYNKVSQAI